MGRPGAPLRLVIGRTIAPPRFLAALILLPLAALGSHHGLGGSWATALALGFDAAAALFLATLVPLLRGGSAETIRARAAANDANRVVVLLVTTVLVLVVMAAIAGELPAARRGNFGAAALLIVTLLLAWSFANSIYALHYAHEYYTPRPGRDGDRGGLDFPATPHPGYGDFAYFAFTLGMTFQTSDVAITTSRVRAVAVLHSFAAFVFNIGVIAFTINALGGGS